MKKYVAMLLALVLALTLATCGGDNGQGSLEITMGQQKDEDVTPTQDGAAQAAEGWIFVYEGVELAIDQPCDTAKLPAPDGSFENPDCALEGKNTTYAYPGLEITTYDQGQGEKLFSVYIMEGTVSTPEGLKVGDALETVIACYGDGFTDNDGEYVYAAGGMELIITHDGQTVTTIEYTMVI